MHKALNYMGLARRGGRIELGEACVALAYALIVLGLGQNYIILAVGEHKH